MKYADGFFDAGILRIRDEGLDNGDPNALDQSAETIRRREVGKKLRLSEY
jgi:hypothetical protein